MIPAGPPPEMATVVVPVRVIATSGGSVLVRWPIRFDPNSTYDEIKPRGRRILQRRGECDARYAPKPPLPPGPLRAIPRARATSVVTNR
ncbi:hypothetical protein GCM10009799_18910 [Nocardiopsis rhodophaea]|uniref:Uncharacterized protein n=1 Tax=Nocardiopsis rhodophaea TaxID=280238 RepID=A0ABP5E848_9ACTN